MAGSLDRFEVISNKLSHLIIAGMMVCMMYIIVAFFELLLPGWNGKYLFFVGFIVALEAIFSQRAVVTLNFPEPEWILFRFTEWLIIILFLKFSELISVGLNQSRVEIAYWVKNFSKYFFSIEFILALFAIFILWLVSTSFAEGLKNIESDKRVLEIESQTGIIEDRSKSRIQIVKLIFLIGSLMIIATAFLRNSSMTKWIEIPAMRGGVNVLLIYFFLALVLLSITQFSLLRVRWYFDKITVRREIANKWILYSFLFILLITVIARILPTNYSIGLLNTFGYILYIVISILNLVLVLIITPFLFIYSLIMGLFGLSETSARITPFTGSVIPTAPPGNQIPWFDLVKSIVFWIGLLGMTGFSIYYYVKERQDLIDKFRRFGLISSFERFLQSLFTWFGGMNLPILNVLEIGIQRLRSRAYRIDANLPWHFVNLRRLSPRERVMFYYLAMVRRGGESGVLREEFQTPYEYSRKLSDAIRGTNEQADRFLTNEKSNLKSESANRSGADKSGISKTEIVLKDIIAITDRFVEARYSSHEISPNLAGKVKRHWEHIKRALKKIKKN